MVLCTQSTVATVGLSPTCIHVWCEGNIPSCVFSTRDMRSSCTQVDQSRKETTAPWHLPWVKIRSFWSLLNGPLVLGVFLNTIRGVLDHYQRCAWSLSEVCLITIRGVSDRSSGFGSLSGICLITIRSVLGHYQRCARSLSEVCLVAIKVSLVTISGLLRTKLQSCYSWYSCPGCSQYGILTYVTIQVWPRLSGYSEDKTSVLPLLVFMSWM